MQRSGPDTSDPESLQEPSPQEVRRELERVLESPFLQSNDKRRAFLRFIVEETLAGRAGNLKGYTVAISVFQRDVSFDPQSDPVVRVEARRLRRDLDSYYMNAGVHDSVRISIPKGSYVPYFEKLHVETRGPSKGVVQPEPGHGISPSEAGGYGVFNKAKGIHRALSGYRAIAVLIVTIVIIASFAWWNRPPQQGGKENEPAVIVLPFKALGLTENSGYFANGISQEFISDLMQFSGFRVYDLTARPDKYPQRALAEIGRDLETAFVITGNLEADPESIHLTVQLLAAATNEVLWTRVYDRPLNPKALIQMQRDLAGEVISELGQPYGVIYDDLKSRMTTPEVTNLQGYICVLQAYDYRRDFDEEKFGPVLACLEKAVQDDPLYSDAWAMLGWLYLDAGRHEFYGQTQPQQEYQKAFQAASRAVQIDPDNTLALKALSSINHYMGQFEEGERLARKAVALNPNDPDALAQLGWRLAARGNFDEGIPMLNQAIERTIDPPGWYYHFIAIDLYRSGEYHQMLSVAERAAKDGSTFGQALIAIASGALEDPESARMALEKMSHDTSLASDPAAYFRKHGATEEIVEMLLDGLTQARRVATGDFTKIASH